MGSRLLCKKNENVSGHGHRVQGNDATCLPESRLVDDLIINICDPHEEKDLIAQVISQYAANNILTHICPGVGPPQQGDAIPLGGGTACFLRFFCMKRTIYLRPYLACPRCAES